jgi:hypothetical protein
MHLSIIFGQKSSPVMATSLLKNSLFKASTIGLSSLMETMLDDF